MIRWVIVLAAIAAAFFLVRKVLAASPSGPQAQTKPAPFAAGSVVSAVSTATVNPSSKFSSPLPITKLS